MKHNAQTLDNLLDEFGAKLSLPGMGWARNYWCNIQAIVDLISTLHAEAKVKKGKGKPIVCSFLGAVVLTAVEHKEHQQNADLEIIALLKDLVKVLQLLTRGRKG